MPFGDLDFEGQFRLSRYRGTIRWQGEWEAYMPDRLARQFGRVQGIPDDPIPNTMVRRPRRLYDPHEVQYDGMWDTWAALDGPRLWDHTASPRYTGEGPSMADGYIEWWLEHAHPYIDPASAPPPPPPRADGASTSGTAGEQSGRADEPSEAPVGELTQTQGAETEVEMLRRRLDAIGDELYAASTDRTLGPRMTTFLDRFWRRHYQS